MPAKLRVASFEGRTEIVPDGVRCGYRRCPKILGDLVSIKGDRHVQLLEGFRKDSDGCYRLHRHAEKRRRLGKAPKDAHPRWTGLHSDGHWGPGAGAQSNPDWLPDVPRERISGREKAPLDGQLQVTCPLCKYSNTLHGDI